MLVEAADQLKLRELKKKNKDESFTVKTNDLIPIGFALTICYLESMRCENEYFSYIGEYYLDVFIKKLNEILSNWDTFKREMEMEMKENQKRKYKKATVSYFYGKKKQIKVRDNCHYITKYQKATYSLCNLQ